MKNEEHVQGNPWKNERTVNTFESADKTRNEILAEGELQAKVRRYGKYPNYTYVVKTRRDPSLSELIKEDGKQKSKSRSKRKRD